MLAGGHSLYAATCFVPTGGTPAYNYASIQAAVNNSACATIRVSPGTYYETIHISRDVNIVGSGAASTVIDAGSNHVPVIGITSGSVRIDSITLRNGWYSKTFDPNQSGGISSLGSGNLYVLNCIVTGNNGHGVEIVAGTLRVEDSTISKNDGDGIMIHGGVGTITRNTITQNLVDGIGTSHSNVAITNSTIAGNQHYGLDADSNLSVSSSTIVDNHSAVYTGIGPISIKSSIIGNTVDQWIYCDPRVEVTDRGNNLRWPQPDLGIKCVGTTGNPNLGPLANNGGLNQTMVPLAGSAAIGQGACSDVNGVGMVVDERLFLRPASGCDIGAVESRAGTTYAPSAAWWRLDEGSGTTAHDSSVHGVNGTVHSSGGGPAWYPSAAPTLFYNSSSLYTGAYNSWVSAPLATTRTDNVSVSMWVNCGGCSTYGHDFVPFYNGEFRWDGYGLYVPANSRHVELIVNGAVHDSGYTLPMTFTWTHLAVVRSNGLWQIYVNGKAVGSSWNWTPNPPVGITSIGADPFGGENFGGIIDDVRVYNRSVSAAEIAWIATGDR